MNDLHNAIKVVLAIAPQAVGTSGIAGGKLSGVIDRRGYGSAEFVFSAGLSGATGDTVVPVVYECDTTGGTFTSVADDDLLGTEDALVLNAAKAGKVGYAGSKPYLKLRLYGVGHATGIVSAKAILSHPHQAPVA